MTSLIILSKLPNWKNTSLCQNFIEKGKITHKKTYNLITQTLLKRERCSKKKKSNPLIKN